MIGCLLLTLGVLTLLAPPVESHDSYEIEPKDPTINYPHIVPDAWEGTPLHAHALIEALATIKHSDSRGVHPHSIEMNNLFGGNLTSLHPDHFEIHWIRVYKNPATMSLLDLQEAGDATAGMAQFNRGGGLTNYVVTPPGFRYRRARLFLSLNDDHQKLVTNNNLNPEDVKDEFFWVKIDPGGGPSDPMSGGLVDRTLADGITKDPNSGLVTDTEHTTVLPGDIVAIAVNVKLTYYKAAHGFWNPDTNAPTDDARTLPWLALPVANPNIGAPTQRPGEPATIRALKPILPLWFNYNKRQRGPDKNVVWARSYGTVLGGAADREILPKNELLDQLAGGAIIAAMHLPGVGTLNPNYPLENAANKNRIIYSDIDRSLTHTNLGHDGMDGYHTLVYQFTVRDTEAHRRLNTEGEWLKRSDRDGNVNPFNMPYKTGFDYSWATFDPTPPEELPHEEYFGFWVPFGDKAATSTTTEANALSSFLDPAEFLKNASYKVYYRHHSVTEDHKEGPATYSVDDLFDPNGDGLLDYILPVEKAGSAPATPAVHYLVRDVATRAMTDRNAADVRTIRSGSTAILAARIETINEDLQSAGFYDADAQGKYFRHYLPPTYDDTAKEAIHYPRVIDAYVAAMTEIDVPSGTQTGPFRVTLRFQEDYGEFQAAPSHGEDVPAALQAALVAGVEHGTVTGLSRLSVADASTRYQVTLEPALGFVGELTLHVPADTVVARNSNLGNLEATLTVPIDTSLQLVSGQEVEVVEPAGDAYQSGDEIEVRVPFATDGLTYEGENPPYVTIYLGEQGAATARHATWQKGSEQSGSTIVPFVYVLQETDPSAETVSVDLTSLSIPRETTLMAASGLERAGTADPAVGVGEAAPVPETRTEPEVSITGPSGEEISSLDPSGERRGTVTVDLPKPVKPPPIYLPPTETDSKSVASDVPRSPIVFNELGNGSEDANDWLEFRNVSGSDVSLKDWELSVVQDGKKEDTSLIVFPEVSVPANGLLLITNMPSDKTPLAGGKDKGLSHASLVDAGLSLPDDGKFLLILRNAKEKLGLDEAFIDVAGGGGSDTDAFVRDETGDYDTYVWPLQVLEAPGDATEDALSSGKVWQRAKADIIGYHQAAWAEAAFTGIGYDRKVSKSAATSGTPGYPNGAAKTAASTPKGAVTISEIMFDSDRGKLPQWIELYNKSKTEALNLDRWQLEIQNRNSEDLIGRPIVTLTLQEKVIQPNQTLLIVAGDARASSADVFPEDRVYNLLELHEKNLRIKTPRDTFLSGEGFYLKLSDRNGTKIDEVGNIDDNRRTDDAPVWVWPTNRREGPRSSVVRRYDKGSDARDGMLKSNWALSANFNRFKVESLHYGHADDIGTPGYRKGGALPVELSSFKVTRTDEGPVIVTWTTESEVDNAGFNLRRSQQRDSGFTLLNPVLIAGAGTTGERQTYTFTDTSAKPGVEYYYQIEEVSLGGRPEVLRTRRLPGLVSPANRALTTFGEVKQRE